MFGAELCLSSIESAPCVDPGSGTEVLVGFDMEQIVIIHKEQRLLIVSVGIQSEGLVFVVLHALDQTHGTLQVTAFNEFISQIKDYSIDLSSAIIIGDFTLRFGSIKPSTVGKYYPQNKILVPKHYMLGGLQMLSIYKPLFQNTRMSPNLILM